MTVTRPGRGRVAMALGAAAALAAAGLAGGWVFAAGRADAALTSWIAQEAAAGRFWTCPERRTQGFPTKLEIVCPKLGFEGEVLERLFVGSVGGFAAEASLFRPQSITVRLASPFSAASAGGDRFTLDWRRLDLALDGAAQAFRGLSLSGNDFSLSGMTAAGAPLDFAASSATATLAPSPRAAGEAPPAYDFEVAVTDAKSPALAALLALNAPVDARASGAVVGADLSRGGGLVERLERWRLAGGRVDLASARLSSGKALFEASGGFDLDQERRPRGEFDMRLSGMEPTLRAFGVSPALISAGSLLTSFLGGAPVRDDRAKPIRLPMRLVDGGVSIGPIRTSLRLPPLY